MLHGGKKKRKKEERPQTFHAEKGKRGNEPSETSGKKKRGIDLSHLRKKKKKRQSGRPLPTAMPLCVDRGKKGKKERSFENKKRRKRENGGEQVTPKGGGNGGGFRYIVRPMKKEEPHKVSNGERRWWACALNLHFIEGRGGRTVHRKMGEGMRNPKRIGGENHRARCSGERGSR